MSVRLVDQIVSSLELHRSQTAVAMALCSDRERQDEEFRRAWEKVYPSRAPYTAAEEEKIVRRLLRLARFVRLRFWDFAIARRLFPEADFYTEVALRLLAHACAGNQAALRFCVTRSRPMFPTVAARHVELFGEIELEMSTGLPPTPALSQAELARALGVSYHKFRGEVRAGHWRAVDRDAVKHSRRRRWRHAAPLCQAEALKRVRMKLRNKLWANLPVDTRSPIGTSSELSQNFAKFGETWSKSR